MCLLSVMVSGVLCLLLNLVYLGLPVVAAGWVGFALCFLWFLDAIWWFELLDSCGLFGWRLEFSSGLLLVIGWILLVLWLLALVAWVLVVVGVACCGVGCFAVLCLMCRRFGLLGFERVVMVMWLVTLLVVSVGWMFCVFGLVVDLVGYLVAIV